MNTPLTRGKLNSQLGMFDEQANLEPSRGSNAFGVRRDYRRGILSLLECKLCGKTFSRITHFHVESKHGISLGEYRRQFPYAPTESESWRESQRKRHLVIIGTMERILKFVLLILENMVLRLLFFGNMNLRTQGQL